MLRTAGRGLRLLVRLLLALASCALAAHFMYRAYSIRLYAVREYGRVIHEFDPWFNFRATQYLHRNGWAKFFTWFDHESWYPLGRPVGTTIYPGMQITAVAIHDTMQLLPKFKVPKVLFNDTAFPVKVPANLRMNFPMSLNDVCVFMPAWFGAVASLALGLLTWEATRSRSAGVVATGVMAVIPAHIMRSVAGGYDNESVAVTAICLTFWLWVRALRTPASWPIGALAGAAYVYMVAAWGGYIFVVNMVGAHAALMVGLGRYSSSLYRAYTLFFVIGTAGATCVPCVAWLPLKSMEQVLPLVVFFVFQVLEFCEAYRRRHPMKAGRFFWFRAQVFAAAAIAASVVAAAMMQRGMVSPLTARIRALFIRHQKTGNPLVDSVAEHSAANEQAYEQYLHHCYHIAPVGVAMCLLHRTPGAWFLVLYACVAYHFSLKMSRLIIICGPVASALTGAVAGYVFDWCVAQLLGLLHPGDAEAPEEPEPERDGGIGSIYRGVLQAGRKATMWDAWQPAVAARLDAARRSRSPVLVASRALAGAAVLGCAAWYLPEKLHEFDRHCIELAKSMSHPQLMFKTRDGRMIDDYRQAYHWVRDNTPQDARVMAWWDYGYQIAGIANRTSIADGNTWNHEHIATLGRCLTSPEVKAHRMIRHLADYVLVWAGGNSDDLAKSPHLARIGNSVYPDHCGDADPTCAQFGFYSYDNYGRPDKPTPMMAESLLYKLHSHNLKPGVHADPKLFREAHSSTHGLVRVFKVMDVSEKSKAWVADPENRLCDAPGSWYCPGQYPPQFLKFMKNKRDFSQLEDFNKKGEGEESAYTKLVRERQKRGEAEGV